MAFAMMRGQFADLRQPFAMVRARTAKIDNRLKNDNQHTNTMKKILMLCTAMVALLVSCSKCYENKIVGTWECVSMIEETSQDGVVNEKEESRNDTLIFYNDGTLWGSSWGPSMIVIGENGNNFTVQSRFIWNQYVIDDNELIFISGDIRLPFKIKSMTSSECVLVYDYEGVSVTQYDSPEPGPSYDILTQTYTLKKI